MERMNKANFWDKLETEYPEQMGDFKKYIDEYKRREDWANLFPGRIIYGDDDVMGKYRQVIPVKFHDLPNAMQIGIFIQYTIENGDAAFMENPSNMQDYQNGILKWFFVEKSLSDREKSSTL